MNCHICKGNIENKNTTFAVDLDNCTVVVRNVPSQVCSQCGETSFSLGVAQRLEDITNSVKNIAPEFAVVSYSDNVA